MELRTPEGIILIIAIIKRDFITLHDVTLDLFFDFVLYNSAISNYLNILKFAISYFCLCICFNLISVPRSLDVIFFKKTHLGPRPLQVQECSCIF